MTKSRQVRKHGRQASKTTRVKRMEDRIDKHNTSASSPAPDNLELGNTAEEKLLNKIAEQPLVTEIQLPPPPEPAPISPARRAFQDA